MRFFGFNISRTPSTPDTRHPAPVTRSLSCSPEEWLRGEDLNLGGATLSNAYQQVVWVYRAINVLAEQVANIPFLFSTGERGRETLITSGPLLDFYARPHPHITRFQYWELRILWLMLRGECFRIPIYEDQLGVQALACPSSQLSTFNSQPSTRRKLARVLILDPAHFHHIVENHELIGWRYTGFGPGAPLASQVFLPEEVWFEKLPNPFDFWRGMSPLYVAETAAKTDFAASSFMRGIIENNADTGVIVRTEKPIDPEQQEQLLSYLRNRKRRAGTADRPIVLSGVTEIVKPELSSSDIQFLENRKFSRGEICAAFGVPEEIITSTEHAKYDVMQGARQNFIENRVAPLCNRLEAEEDATVKSLDGRAVGWFDLDSLPIMQQARRARLTTAQNAFAMGVPFNELNRVLDLGFKALPWGDKGYVAANLQEAGAGDGKSLKLPSSGSLLRQKHCGGRESTTDGGQTPKSEQHETRTPRGVFRETPSPKLQADGIEHALEFLAGSQLSTPNSQLARKLRRFLFEQRGRVLGKLCGVEEGVGRIGQIGPMIEEVFDLPAENQTLLAMMQPFGMAEESLTEINQKIFEALTRVFQEGVKLGETREQLAGRVKAIYNTVASTQAQ